MATTTCPSCKRPVDKPVVTLTRGQPHELVFQGCPDCLITLLMELKAHRASPCIVCGATKQKVVFAGLGEKLECPVHSHARGLLAQALSVLRRVSADESDPEIRDLCMKLVDVLGVAKS